MNIRMRTDGPHGQRASHRRLAIERCEDRIALSATSDTAAEFAVLSDPSKGGVFLSGASFALFDSQGQVLATARFNVDSDSLTVDYTSGDSFQLNGESLRLSDAGIPNWMGDSSWKVIPPPEEIPGGPGEILSLPFNDPGGELPVAEAVASGPQMFSIASSEQEFQRHTALQSADVRGGPLIIVQPQHDRPRNSAVFFEVATTNTSPAVDAASPPSYERLVPRASSSPAPPSPTTLPSAGWPSQAGSSMRAPNHLVAWDEWEDLASNSTHAEPPGTLHSGQSERGAADSERASFGPPAGGGAEPSRHAAFAALEFQENAPLLVSSSRSHYPELLAVALTLMAATDRQLATRKSITSCTVPASSSRYGPPEGESES